MTLTQPNNITIRNTRPEDLEAVASLFRQLWPSKKITPASLKDSFTKSFTLDGHIIRVAVHEETIVGLCSLYIRNNLKAECNLANIDELVVDDKMRNRQIGKMLLDDAEKTAREHQCKFLGLESSFHREEAHRFYESNGYQKQGYYIIKNLIK